MVWFGRKKVKEVVIVSAWGEGKSNLLFVESDCVTLLIHDFYKRNSLAGLSLEIPQKKEIIASYTSQFALCDPQSEFHYANTDFTMEFMQIFKKQTNTKQRLTI